MHRIFAGKKIRIIGVCITTLIFLFFFGPPLFSGIRNVSIRVFSLPVKLFSKTGQHFVNKKDLIRENKILQKKVGDLSLSIGQFDQLRDENERLRSLLDFKKKIKFNTISAEIVARNPNRWTGSFFIDKGSRDKIKKDSAVCSAEGILLGRVLNSDNHTSSVIPVTHPGFKAGGMLKDTKASGIVVGTGGGRAKMLYIPIDAKVRRGAIIVTSDLSKIFPKDIVIGKVASVGKSKTGLYKYAIIKPSANSFNYEEVLCIIGE